MNALERSIVNTFFQRLDVDDDVGILRHIFNDQPLLALFHYIFTRSKASYTATKSPAWRWPQRRVSTSSVQIPAQTTAGSPDCAAHALINARDVSLLRI